MWWVHHLDAEKREELERSLTVPLLPESPKLRCGSTGMLRSDGSTVTPETLDDETHVCSKVNEANSCDWCHSTQADHDKGLPGTSPPDATKKFTGPDDGNPQGPLERFQLARMRGKRSVFLPTADGLSWEGWNRTRRCDQD